MILQKAPPSTSGKLVGDESKKGEARCHLSEWIAEVSLTGFSAS
jgi:hypothetical protein